MMSDTSARARRLARWFGSLERNGLTGLRAPPSPTAGDGEGGVAGGGGDAGTCRAAGGGAGVCRAWPPYGGDSHPAEAGGVGRTRSAGVAAGVAVRAAPPDGVGCPVGAGIVMTPLHTEQRARTPEGGTLAGSTLKIERQSGQLTFIHSLR